MSTIIEQMQKRNKKVKELLSKIYETGIFSGKKPTPIHIPPPKARTTILERHKKN